MYASFMTRVLVTGATGFIGRHSLPILLERGYEVHAVRTSNVPALEPQITWHQADLFAGIGELCAEIQASHLLHFAWYVNPADYKTSPENDRWKEATLALVRDFQESGGERAILAGTCMEYDWSTSEERLHELYSPVHPRTRYGVTKNDTRLAAEEFAAKSRLSLGWARIFNLFGPHEAKTRLVPQIIRALTDKKEPNIPAGGFVRDYSYVKDIAGAFVAFLESDVTGPVNIASGDPIRLKAVADTIAGLLNAPELTRNISSEISDTEPERIVADITRLSKEIGWHPRYDLVSGLTETIAWWNSENAARS